MKTVLVWETLPFVSGGQKMTLTVSDLLADEYKFVYLIPEKGSLSEVLDERGVEYYLLGSQDLPTGVKGKRVVPAYAAMSLRVVSRALKIGRHVKPDMVYVPGPAALPWGALYGTLAKKPVVWHLHHLFLDGMTKKLLNGCAGWKSVRKIISVSNCVGAQISNPKAQQKKVTIYNPVDVEKYAGGNAEVVYEEYPQLRKISGGGASLR